MITCIACRFSWTAEPSHAFDCVVPTLAILDKITALERLKRGTS